MLYVIKELSNKFSYLSHIEYYDDIVKVCGFSSAEIDERIGDKFPIIQNREFLKYENGQLTKVVINEWTPTNYFNSIPMVDDDKGKCDIVMYGPSTGQYIACAITESNLKRAFLKRMVYGGNKQLSGYTLHNHLSYDSRLDFFTWFNNIFLEEYITPLEPGWTFETALSTWLDHSKRYTLKTKESLINLQKRMLSPGYEAKFHGKNDPLGLQTINIFQKCENYPDIKEARAISPCSQEVKALLGGFIHLCDEHLIKTTNFFVKTMNPYKIQKKMREIASRWSCFMGSDYSSYEGSQDYDWLNNVELKLYKKLFANYPEVYDYFRLPYENGHYFYYKHRKIGHLYGKRMSGDMQTSIGNGITNASIWLYTAFKHNQGIEFLVEGDDAFLCSDSPLDTTIVNSLGFDCKIDGPSHNYQDIMFLSMICVDKYSYANFYKILDKIGVVKSLYFSQAASSNRQSKKLEDYLYTKAYCFLYMYPCTPILSTILSRMCELSHGHFNINLMEDYYYTRIGDSAKVELYQDIPEIVRIDFANRYPNFPIQKQKLLEKEFRSAKSNRYLFRNIFDLAPIEKNLL